MDRRELEQLFAFDRWANRQTLSTLRGLDGGGPDQLRELLWHTLTATDNWLSRIEGTEPFEPLGWEGTHTLDDVAGYLERIEAKSMAFVDAFPPVRLNEGFEYRNSSGVAFSNIVADALHHVILHGVEHRAHVMWEVGKLGGEPVELEYAWFLREPPADK